MKLSLCICTYNRAEVLDECLDSILKRKEQYADVEVLVVNNNSSDATLQVCEKYKDQIHNFHSVTETTQGLSFARNRAFKEAKSEWVYYLDDDALVTDGLIEKIIFQTENSAFDVFGGRAIPWYKFGKPSWYKDEYGSYSLPHELLSKVDSPYFLIGVQMIFKKALLEKYKGFNTSIGMIGDSIGYGEETEIQMRMIKDGVQIFYDPSLVVEHLVPKYKMEIDWFFKSAFSLGRDSIEMKSRSSSYLSLLMIAITAFVMFWIHLVVYTPKLLKKDYYIQNWLIDVFKKIAKRIGIIYHSLLSKNPS